MHRTQIYFEELKSQANTLGISLSAYIRDTLKKDLQEKKTNLNLMIFLNFQVCGEGRDTTQVSLREQAWK